MLAISFCFLAIITSRKEFVRLSVCPFLCSKVRSISYFLWLSRDTVGVYGRRHKSELKSKARFRANLHFAYQNSFLKKDQNRENLL